MCFNDFYFLIILIEMKEYTKSLYCLSYFQGKLKWKETITEGFENLPDAFYDMLIGKSIGNAIVKAKP